MQKQDHMQIRHENQKDNDKSQELLTEGKVTRMSQGRSPRQQNDVD